MSENPEQPQRVCTNCGAEIRPDIAFCVSCGEQLEGNQERGEAEASAATTGSRLGGVPFLEERRVRLIAYGVIALLVLVTAFLLLSYSLPLGLLVIGLCVSAILVVRKNRGSQTGLERQGFEAASRYKQSAQNVYETYKLRAEFDRYKRFFAEAQDGSLHFLEWWNQYAQDERPHAQSPIPSLLDNATNRSRAGHGMMQDWEVEFNDLLAEGRFPAARFALTRVREGQEEGVVEGQGISDPSKSVLIPLDEVQRQLRNQGGWARYEEEFAQFALKLRKILDSPVLKTATEAEEAEARDKWRAEAQKLQAEQKAEQERLRQRTQAEQERLRRYPDPHKTLTEIREEERKRREKERAQIAAQRLAARQEAAQREQERRSRQPTVGDLEDMERRKAWRDFWEKQNKGHR